MLHGFAHVGATITRGTFGGSLPAGRKGCNVLCLCVCLSPKAILVDVLVDIGGLSCIIRISCESSWKVCCKNFLCNYFMDLDLDSL